MGTEFGQFKEWDFQGELDWGLLKYPAHQQMHKFFKAINHFYLENRPMWEIDFSWEGFSWISNDDYQQSVISFRRIDRNGREIIAVCNFQPVQRDNYRIGIPAEGTYAEIFNSEDVEFGGCGVTNGNSIKTECEPMHGYDQSVVLTLPPMSVIYLKCVRKKSKRAVDSKEPTAAAKIGVKEARQAKPAKPVKATRTTKRSTRKTSTPKSGQTDKKIK